MKTLRKLFYLTFIVFSFIIGYGALRDNKLFLLIEVVISMYLMNEWYEELGKGVKNEYKN